MSWMGVMLGGLMRMAFECFATCDLKTSCVLFLGGSDLLCERKTPTGLLTYVCLSLRTCVASAWLLGTWDG